MCSKSTIRTDPPQQRRYDSVGRLAIADQKSTQSSIPVHLAASGAALRDAGEEIIWEYGPVRFPESYKELDRCFQSLGVRF